MIIYIYIYTPIYIYIYIHTYTGLLRPPLRRAPHQDRPGLRSRPILNY